MSEDEQKKEGEAQEAGAAATDANTAGEGEQKKEGESTEGGDNAKTEEAAA